MSKGDGDKDETPIQFYIPRISSRGRAPIPVNQPYWKYGSHRSPKPAEWVVANILGLLLVTAIYLVVTKSFGFPVWMGWVVAFLGMLLFAGLNIRLYKEFAIHRKSLEENKSRKKTAEKKQPKRRKDYR